MARFIGFIISDRAEFVNGFSRGFVFFGTLTRKPSGLPENFGRMRKRSTKNFLKSGRGAWSAGLVHIADKIRKN